MSNTMTDKVPLPEVGYLGDDCSYGYDAHDMRDYALAVSAADNAALRAENERLRRRIEVPTIDRGSQNWKALDGATAFHLIERHADGWADVAQMMDEWLEARTDTLSKRVEELEAASQWRPIETAPKDGTLFLCWVSAVCYQESDEGQQYQQDVSQVDFCNWRTQADIPDCGWFDPCCGQIGDQQGVTHWMPLPSQPKEPT